jgi:hypothetical protein
MEQSVPASNYFPQKERFKWPAYKFGMKLDEFITILKPRFNTLSLPLLDDGSFLEDVNRIAEEADSKEEFLKHLEQHSEGQKTKLLKSWQSTTTKLITSDTVNIPDDTWVAAVRFMQTKSIESLIQFFDELSKDSHTTSRPETLFQTSQEPKLSCPMELGNEKLNGLVTSKPCRNRVRGDAKVTKSKKTKKKKGPSRRIQTTEDRPSLTEGEDCRSTFVS